ncbi:MAG: hypothetical protein KF708_17790 [Pirellulales bacterium]|nr:hypothetical protein [Pirellulales bacterium]
MKTAASTNIAYTATGAARRLPLSRRRALRAGGSRRGALSGMLVVGLILLFAVLGLALELGLIAHVQVQLQTATDAAALAGAAELLDESVLRPGESPDWTDDIELALKQSQVFAASNVAGGQTVAILPNPQNDPNGDFIVAWLESSTNPGEVPQLYPDSGRCNTLIVRAQRTQGRGNPVPLWFSPVVGIATADVLAESRATLDQRICGFRPQGLGAIPVVPLAALAKGSQDAWFEQSQTTPIEGVNDKYTVDYRTGVVTKGPDGIPEIELKSPLEDDAGTDGNFLVLEFNPDPQQQNQFQRQLELGLTAADLVDQNGQLLLDKSGQLVVPGTGINEKLLGRLTTIVGENRVWPLFSEQTDSDGTTAVVLTGFAAGRIVDARVNEDDEAVVLVQASTLVTGTALVRELGPHDQRNPWIARLCLTR